MFFDDWTGIGRTLVVGVSAYIGVIVFVRLAGKRSLSKLNAFDLIITVALGSTLATILLARDVALAEGLTAFALLIGLQFVITWASVRTRFVPSLVKSEPTLLVHRGRQLDDALRSQRISEAEVLQAVRQQGFASVADVHAVVLETDGSLSVIGDAPSGDRASSLRNVVGWDDGEPR
ncbi:MAG TPA: YetF domain-containing protein [Candidatus Angelobacter sp.]|nr:YetF domain-containing protein [Candidatus Angelobacter sp.]